MSNMLALPAKASDTFPKSRNPMPFGWVVLGFFLLPITALLTWANYTLLVLGLEAAFGFKRIEWEVFGFVITAEDVVAVVWLLAELLAGFFLAELLGWVDLLEFDDRFEPRQRRRLAWFIGLLFAALVAGEVGIGLFRQWRIEQDARLREQAAQALSAPASPPAEPNPESEVDLNQSPSTSRTGETLLSRPASSSTETASGWTGFVQSLPSVGIVLVHTAVPCLSAVGGVFAAPLAIFVSGVLLTLLTVVPLTLLIVPLDLLIGGARGCYALLVGVLQLVALPARLLVEAGYGLRRR